MSELLPCPWCGGINADSDIVRTESADKKRFGIACINPKCLVQPQFTAHSRECADAEWNDRRTTQKVDDRERRLVEKAYREGWQDGSRLRSYDATEDSDWKTSDTYEALANLTKQGE